MSDQPVAEASVCTGQHNIQTQETNIHAASEIRTRKPSNRAAADLRLNSRGHWDRQRLKYTKPYFCHLFCMGVKLYLLLQGKSLD
jgi:hypothetical protein